jgi:hypothetical protein
MDGEPSECGGLSREEGEEAIELCLFFWGDETATGVDVRPLMPREDGAEYQSSRAFVL